MRIIRSQASIIFRKEEGKYESDRVASRDSLRVHFKLNM